MKLLIRCGIQQERISECMDWVKTHAGRNPARALSSAFFFGRSKRQGALANAVEIAGTQQRPIAHRKCRPSDPLVRLEYTQFPERGAKPTGCADVVSTLTPFQAQHRMQQVGGLASHSSNRQGIAVKAPCGR